MSPGVARAVLGALLMCSGAVKADLDSVYAPAPPPNLAFVRFVNLTGQPLQVTLAPGQSLRLDRAQPVSRYEIVAEGGIRARLEGKTASSLLDIRLPAQRYATVALGAETPARFMADDASPFNMLKSRLSFYNLSGCSKAQLLALAPNEVPVFKDIAPAQSAQRLVNPTRVSFLVRCADDAHPTPPLEVSELRAGERFSLFLLDAGKQRSLVGVTDRTAPTQR